MQDKTYTKRLMMKDGKILNVSVTYSEIVQYLKDNGREKMLTKDEDKLFKDYLHALKIDYNRTLPKAPSSPSNRGGKRENSGRKSKSGSGPSKFVSFRCSQEVYDILSEVEGSRTAYIEDAIKEKHRRAVLNRY